MKHVFVSSTFKDMQFERDALRTVAAVNINKKLSAYGEEVYFTDLRWGVNTTSLDSEEGCRRVLEVCLDEIDDCRPHMIVLVGERYGWIPEGDVIRDAAAAKGIEVGDEISVTQLEIEYGALVNRGSAGKVFFYFRELDTEGMSAEQLADYTAESELHRSRIEALKHRLKRLYPDSVRTYTAKFDKETQSVAALEGFLEAVCADLSHSFLCELREEESLPWQVRAMRSAERYYLELSKHYYDAERKPLTLYDGTFAEKRCAFRFIKGDSGTGKSSFLAYSYAEAKREGGDVMLLPFVLGLDKYSTTEADYFKLLLYRLEQALGEEHKETAYGTDACEDGIFERILMLEGRLGSRVHSFIDNCSYELQNTLSVNLLDAARAEGDVFALGTDACECESLEFTVAYSADEPPVLLPPAFDYSRTYVCGDVSEEDQAPLVRMLLRRKHKELDESVIAAITEKEQAVSPFYLKLAVDRMLMLDSRDFSEIRAMGDGMDNINRYQISVVNSLSDTSDALATELIRCVSERVGESFVMRLVALLLYGEARMSESLIERVFLARGWAFSSLSFSLATRALSAVINYNPKDKTFAIVNGDVIPAVEDMLDAGGYSYVAKELAEYASRMPGGADILLHALSRRDAAVMAKLYIKMRERKKYLIKSTDWLILRKGAEYVAKVLINAADGCPEFDFSFIISAIPTSCLTIFDRDAYEALLQTLVDEIEIKKGFLCNVNKNSLAVFAWIKLVNIRMSVNTSDAAPVFHSFIDAGYRACLMTPEARIMLDATYYRFMAREAFHSMRVIMSPEVGEPACAYLIDKIEDTEQRVLLMTHLFGGYAAYLRRAFEPEYEKYAEMARRGCETIGESVFCGDAEFVTADDVAMLMDSLLDDRDDMLRADTDSVSFALRLMAAGQRYVNPRLLKYLPRILYAAKYSLDGNGGDFSDETVKLLLRLCATSRAVAGNALTVDDALYAAVQMEQSYDIISDRISAEEHLAFITHLEKFVRILLSEAPDNPRVLYRCYLPLRKILGILELYDFDRAKKSMLSTLRSLSLEDAEAPLLPELFTGALIYRYGDGGNIDLGQRLRAICAEVEESDEYSAYASAYSPELMFLGIDLRGEDEISADGELIGGILSGLDSEGGSYSFVDGDDGEYSLDDDDDFSLDGDDFDDEEYGIDDDEYDLDDDIGTDSFDLDTDGCDGGDGELDGDEFSASQIKDMLDLLKKGGISIEDLLGNIGDGEEE